MATRFHNLPGIHDMNYVCVHGCGETVRHNDDCPAHSQFWNRSTQAASACFVSEQVGQIRGDY